MATPILSAVPTDPPTYNPSMADTFSWVPVQGAGRTLFARACYLVGAGLSLDVGDIDINLADVETLITSSNTKLDALTATIDSIEAKQNTTNSLLSSQLGQSGFVFLTGGAIAINGNFSTVQVVSACKIASIAATNSNTSGLTGYELPVNFSFNGPITSISLTYGAAIVYKL